MMTPGIANAFQDGYEEYLIGGQPDKLTIEEVDREKKKFTDLYGGMDSFPVPAFIPFAILYAREHMEDTMDPAAPAEKTWDPIRPVPWEKKRNITTHSGLLPVMNLSRL